MTLVGQSTEAVVVWLSLALGAVALGSLGTLLVVLARLRARRPDPAQPAPAVMPTQLVEALHEAERQIEELSATTDRWRQEAQWTRRFTEIAATVDLDEVLSRILAAAAEVAGVDTAMIIIDPTDDRDQIVATFGMSAEEVDTLRAPAIPEVRGARAVSVSYRYSRERDEADGSLLRGGVVIPLESDAGVSGSLAAFWRSEGDVLGNAELAQLEELASHSAPAIANAQRFRHARELATLDPLTSLYNRRFFDETLDHEIARSHRYRRPLALLVVDIDGFKEVNDRLGHLSGDAVLADLAGSIRKAVRSSDIACRVGGDEFAIVLPESTIEDAERLYRRLRHAVSTRPTPADRLDLSAGISQLAPDDTAESLFRRGDDALYQAKAGGRGQLRIMHQASAQTA